MDHEQLMEQIKHRLDETDAKIDRNNEKLDDLRKDFHEYSVKTAVLETQMSGIAKVSMLLMGSAIGIIAYIFKKGIFE